MIDYNILCLQESIKNVFSVTVKQGGSAYNHNNQQHNGAAIKPLMSGNGLAIDKTIESGSSAAVVVVGAAGDSSVPSQTSPVPLV